MPASGPRSRGAKVHPRSCQGCQPWPRASAASGLVLANQKLDGITGRGTSAPPSNTCRLLARDHAAPESTLALAKAASLGRERVRPLAWCSRPRNSAALLEGALMVGAADWAGVAQQVVAGLSSGGIYAILAVAFVLIYRATGVVNFAQGELAMFSTFVAWTLNQHGFGYWPAFVVTVLASFAGGIALERVVIRPVERASVLTIAIVTIGLFYVVNGAAFWIWSPEVKSMPNAFSTRPIRIAGVAFSISDLGIIGVSLLTVLVLWLFFRFTKLGLAMRAAALNPESSRLTGIRVSWTIALGWGLATALGAVAGLMAAPPLGSFDQNFMQPILLYAFAGAVLGGIDSALGAVVGSLALGVFLNLLGTYVSWVGTDLPPAAALAVILGVLLVRPAGLFGKALVGRV